MRAVLYNSALQGVPVPYRYSLLALPFPTGCISTCHGLCQEDPSLPSHAQAAGWTERGCLDLHDLQQQRVDSPCRLLELTSLATTARPGPVPQLGPAPYWWHWSWLRWTPWNRTLVEALLNERNTRTHAGPAQLLFRQLSTQDSRRLRHLEVSRWKGYVGASMRRFFINPRGDLYPKKDGIQYNADQLAILRRLFPLIHREFATAARYTDQMGTREQETMDLILAHERELQAKQAGQCDPRLHSRDEVNSHVDSPRVAGAAPARNVHAETTSVEPRPSTSTGSPDMVCITPVTPKVLAQWEGSFLYATYGQANPQANLALKLNVEYRSVMIPWPSFPSVNPAEGISGLVNLPLISTICPCSALILHCLGYSGLANPAIVCVNPAIVCVNPTIVFQ